jgi:hypothetical protein
MECGEGTLHPRRLPDYPFIIVDRKEPVKKVKITELHAVYFHRRGGEKGRRNGLTKKRNEILSIAMSCLLV